LHRFCVGIHFFRHHFWHQLYRDGGICWEITDSATQFQLSLFVSDFTVGITLMPSSNSRTRKLSNRRLSISRTVDSRSLDISYALLNRSLLRLSKSWLGSKLITFAPTFLLSLQPSTLISSGSNLLNSRTVGPKVALRRTQ
jgi:hypothetical protein